jgi:hypothetical protein
MLAIVLVHGVFWSGLLSASAARISPPPAGAAARRGDQLLGHVSVAAIAVAPPIAFWIMQHGRLALDLRPCGCSTF